MSGRRLLGFIAALGALLAARAVLAHHSFSAEFDADKPLKMTGTVTKVEIFQGTTSLGVFTSGPYTLTWSNVPPGTYALTARATDDYGLIATSSVVNITVSLPSASALKLWLKADAITGISSGNPVATWSDSSGAGNNATQTTGANQPLYISNVLGGLPVVRFDGVNDVFNLPNLLNGATQAEAYVVLKSQDAPAASRGLWRMGGSGSGSVTYPATDGTVLEVVVETMS